MIKEFRNSLIIANPEQFVDLDNYAKAKLLKSIVDSMINDPDLRIKRKRGSNQNVVEFELIVKVMVDE